MSNKIEEKVKKCRKCKKITIHKRNSSSMGALGIIINIILVIATYGLWLAPLLFYVLLTAKIGGWHCSEC